MPQTPDPHHSPDRLDQLAEALGFAEHRAERAEAAIEIMSVEMTRLAERLGTLEAQLKRVSDRVAAQGGDAGEDPGVERPPHAAGPPSGD